jgi:hypothetical protein
MYVGIDYFRLSRYLLVYVNPYLWLLHRVDMGDVANVP